MKQPLHSRNRFFLSLIFIVLFFVFIPVVVLYSVGYRLGSGFVLNPTGGVYVFYPESGAEVYLNGTLGDRTSLFSRGIFIDNLKPSTVNLEVKKPGYIAWNKTVEVKEKKVTEAYPYLIPEIIATSSIPRFVTLGSGSSVTNGLYDDVIKLFATTTASTTKALVKRVVESTTTLIIATSTAIVKKDVEIEINGTQVMAIWKGSKDSKPFYFCSATRSSCVDSVLAVEGNISHVDFYPGRSDVILYSLKDGMYATELDKRLPVNTHKLLSGNLDFKEDNGRIFIKEKNSYYELIFTASSTLVNPISI